MKRLILSAFVLALVLLSAPAAFAQCVKIQSGTLTDVTGIPITLGYDQWGYNYQAHMFNGLYANYLRPAVPVSTGGVNLIMKWSDDWLANQSCDNNSYLDRGLNAKTGFSTGISAGWLTNHMEGDCTNPDTLEIEHYTYFVKIVWVGPAADPDPWAGKRIWGVYAIIEEVSNNAPPAGGPDDPNAAFVCGGTNGGDRSKLAHPAGFGAYK